jgi:hypothetical protein
MIIGLGYKKRMGKDTVADYLVENYNFKKIAFADGVRSAVEEVFGFTQEQMLGDNTKEKTDPFWGFSPRYAATNLGELMKKIHPNVWTIKTFKQIDEWTANGEDVVVTDMRFFIEYDGLRERDATLVNVYRPFIMKSHYSQFELTQYKYLDRLIWTKKHVSETQLDEKIIDFDHFIWNDEEGNLERVYDQVEELIHLIS